ncbi:MAG: metallophosphoesterase [Mucilaginibacter sp.]|nr:metallophosphoesterase [Mucilaginibacter sp.]
MKHIIIGDLHGRNVWQQIDIERYDIVVFLGDYVDSVDKTDEAILENLKEILELKHSNPEKVILLWGNHDVQYLHFPLYRCTNFRQEMQFELTSVFNENRSSFQMAYQKDNYLFTHAGLSNAWYNEFLSLPVLRKIKDDTDTIADLINKLEETAQRGLLYRIGADRGGHGNGGILWADILETSTDLLNGYHQVVGHTKVPRPKTISAINESITYIDVLSNQVYFHELDI